MAHWRVQLHPDDPSLAVRHAVTSLAAGLIGLDFSADPGDLMLTQRSALPQGQADSHDFAHTMAIGDLVLIVVHTVDGGDYASGLRW